MADLTGFINSKLNQFKQKVSNAINDNQGFVQQGKLTAQPLIPAIKATGNFLNRGMEANQAVGSGIINTPSYTKNVFSSVSTPEKQAIFQSKPVNNVFDFIKQYVGNNYVAPISQVPYNIGQVGSGVSEMLKTGGKQGKLKTLSGGVGVLGGTVAMVPDLIGDVALPAYNYLKGVRSAQLKGEGTLQSYKTGLSSLSGQKPVGLGEALSKNETVKGLGNLAELPLMLFAGKLATRPKIDTMKVSFYEEPINQIAKEVSLFKNGTIKKLSEQVFKQADEVASELIPEVVRNPEMQAIKNNDPQTWLKYIDTFLQDRLVQARNPEYNIGLNTRNIKRLDQSTKGSGTNVLQENKQLPQPELPERILNKQGLPQSTLSDTDVSLTDSINRIKQEVITNKGSAEVAEQTREMFTPTIISEINKLKRMSKSKAFLEGDIETLRKNGPVVDKVIEAVREVRPDITDEAGALDFALNFPTKSQTTVKKPVLTKEEKLLRLNRLKEEQKWQLEQQQLVDEIGGAKGDPRQIFQQYGATLTPRQYANQRVKKLKVQSEGARIAQNEYNDYLKTVSSPAYKKGGVNLGDGLPADELLKTKKDKVAFAYQRETIQRNIEDIFGKNSKMKSFVVDNITNNENKSIKFQNDLRVKLGSTFKNLGIKKGSKQDYATADFIEGNLSLEELKKLFPRDWQNILKASEEGRVVYKSLLGQINEQLTRFGYDPIPERQNYVTHTTQLQTFADKLGSFFNLNSAELPRAMAGINMETKPGRKFFSFGLQRRGGSTHEGLITALDKYIPSASRQIFHTEDIQRGRAILDLLQKSAVEGDTRLSGFTSYFSQYVDHLAGKQNIIDRPIEKVFGRKFLEVGNWIRQRTGANMVGANLSSAITNFIPFTQSASTTSKPAFVKGLLEATLNYGKEPSVVDGVQSGFLLRRFAKDRITGTLGENIQDIASLPFKLVDKFTSTAIVAGKYFEQLSKGLSKEKAMAVADDYAQRVMADRSFGQTPLLFNSKVLGALTQFQLEVNNQMSFLLKDIPKNMGYSKVQIASSLVQFAIYSYIFNEIFQKVTGRRPQIDPIQAAITTAQGLEEGQGIQAFNPIDPYTKGISDKTGTGQILNQLPFTSIGGGRIPITSAFKQPQYYIIPPFGGGQIKKSIEGIRAYNKGYSENASGNIQYPINKNLPNAIRTAVFGKYSVPEATKYFKDNEKVLSDKQTELFKQSSGEKYYEKIMNKRDRNDLINKAKDSIKNSGGDRFVEGVYVYPSKQFDSETGKMKDVIKTIDTTKKIETINLTGKPELDKKIIARYNSSITSKINDITDLYKLGKIDATTANEQIKELNLLKKKTSKPKKVSIKAIKIKKTPKPKITKFKVAKLKAIKFKKPKIAKLKLKKPKLKTVANKFNKSLKSVSFG